MNWRTRRTGAVREVEWLPGERRFPGEMRLPDAASIVRAAKDRKPVKPRRKVAGWTSNYLDQILNETVG